MPAHRIFAAIAWYLPGTHLRTHPASQPGIRLHRSACEGEDGVFRLKITMPIQRAFPSFALSPQSSFLAFHVMPRVRTDRATCQSRHALYQTSYRKICELGRATRCCTVPQWSRKQTVNSTPFFAPITHLFHPRPKKYQQQPTQGRHRRCDKWKIKSKCGAYDPRNTIGEVHFGG